MDACYYFSGGINLAAGRGLSEDFLWTYLDDPSTLPHPAFTYWMPLPSLVSSIGMAFSQVGFRQAQLPFLVLAILFPLFVYWLGYRWTGNNRIAVLAGIFSISSGFYAVYWLNIESFLLYAWIGGLLLAAFPGLMQTESRAVPWLAGFLCGLAHLARADGILWLGLIMLAIAFSRSRPPARKLAPILVVLTGYACIAGFWYIRNIVAFGSPLTPGGLRTLWFTAYNDLFHFPAADLTVERFLSSGWMSVLAVRWEALLWNLQTLFFVLGLVFLAPFIAGGLYILRRYPAVRLGLIYLGILFLLMTFVYPLQGSRGSFFHSSSALLALVSIAAAVGVERSVEWVGQKRGWNLASARWVLITGLGFFSILASAWIFHQRVIGDDITRPVWSGNSGDYAVVIDRLGTVPVRVMVNNPPCFWVQTGLQAVALPDGGVSTLLQAADRFSVQYVLLDSNSPAGLFPFYSGAAEDSRLKLVLDDVGIGDRHYVVYSIQPAQPAAVEQDTP
jgi:hypothetical protein